MDVIAGYKPTEIGVIPEDWNVVSIGSLANFTSGTGISVATLHRQSSDTPVPVYGGNGIAGYTTDALVQKPVVVVGRVGQKCGEVYLTQGPAWITDNALYPRAIFQPLDICYLALALKAAGLNDVRNRNDLPLITQSILHSIRIFLPPTKAEQEAIAKALSDADALIESLEQLIAKKRYIKQGAMQQILGGRERLSGFRGEWKERTLGDLFTFKNGLNKGKEYFGYGTPIVNYMDVFGNSAICPCNLEGRVSVNRTELQNFDVKAGDVFFTRTSETTEEIGMAAVILGQPENTVFSGFVLRGRPKDDSLSDSYKVYCFQPVDIRKQIISKASYTTRALTNGRLLSTVKIRIPEKIEQTAIATILSDMDTEIAALESKLTKYRQLKQGMMHNLLTGKIRLV